MTQENVWMYRSYIFSSSSSSDYYSATFVRSFLSYNLDFIVANGFSFDFSNNRIKLNYNSNPDDGSYGQKFSLYCIVVIIDKLALKLSYELTHLFYQLYQSSNNPLALSNYLINTSVFGTNFDRQCILGFYGIQYLYPNSATYLFDLDPIIGIINKNLNTYGYDFRASNFCFKDMKCPTTNPYKLKDNYLLCYDCATGSIQNQSNYIFILF